MPSKGSCFLPRAPDMPLALSLRSVEDGFAHGHGYSEVTTGSTLGVPVSAWVFGTAGLSSPEARNHQQGRSFQEVDARRRASAGQPGVADTGGTDVGRRPDGIVFGKVGRAAQRTNESGSRGDGWVVRVLGARAHELFRPAFLGLIIEIIGIAFLLHTTRNGLHFLI